MSRDSDEGCFGPVLIFLVVLIILAVALAAKVRLT